MAGTRDRAAVMEAEKADHDLYYPVHPGNVG